MMYVTNIMQHHGLMSSARAQPVSYLASRPTTQRHRHLCFPMHLTGQAPMLSSFGINNQCTGHQQLLIAAYQGFRQDIVRSHARRVLMCRASARGAMRQGQPQAWQIICAVTAISMMLCNMHRSVFTIMTPAVASHFALELGQVGLVQSAMLAGYMAGQVPAGMVSDRYGGEWVMIVCLLLWSISLWVTGSATSQGTLIASRIAFGLASACAMPAVSAMASRHVPVQVKASTIASIYMFFSLGGVFGLVVTPTLSMGWRAIMHMAAMGGIAWALVGMGLLKGQAIPTSAHAASHVGAQQQGSLGREEKEVKGGPLRGWAGQVINKRWLSQILILCWSHAVIGWGFFIFQSWIPLYLRSLGPMSSLATTGSMSAVPWLAAGVVGAVSGGMADRLITQRSWARQTVRRLLHGISTLGCLACLVPLVLLDSVTPVIATAYLTVFNCCYACSFGGFHAYIQDVATRGSAGCLTGLTNTCGILMGIIGNLSTGWIVQATGSYKGIFLVTGALYVTSFLAFLALDGKEV